MARPDRRKGELTLFVGGDSLWTPPLDAEGSSSGAGCGGREMQAGSMDEGGWGGRCISPAEPG